MFLSVLPLTAQNTLANSCHSLQYTDGSEGVKATIIKVLFAEMYVDVVFVIVCLYSAVKLTLVEE